MTAEADFDGSSVEQGRGRLVELSYLTANQTRLINYGREYREGHRMLTARVESTVEQLVDWRIKKKQHMRWTDPILSTVRQRYLMSSDES